MILGLISSLYWKKTFHQLPLSKKYVFQSDFIAVYEFHWCYIDYINNLTFYKGSAEGG